MTTKNTATKKTTTTKAKATGDNPAAAPKKEESVAILKKAGIEIETPPKDVKIIFSKEIIEESKVRSKKIRDSIGGIDESMETIALNLYWFYSHSAYKSYGFDSLVQFAYWMFGFGKSTCYALISIVERFAKRDEEGNLLEVIDPRYKDYGTSKLSLMVGLTDEQIEKGIKPVMSVREIKKYINSLKEKPIPSLPDGNGEEEKNTAGEGAGNVSPLGLSKNGFYSRQLFLIYDFDDYNSKLDKIDDVIHKLYKEMPNVKIRIEIDSEEPIHEKWGDYTVPVKNDKWG